MILGDTRETLSARTGRPIEEIYEDEVQAVVVHGDDIDGLQGWQWDQSKCFLLLVVPSLLCANGWFGFWCVVFSKDEIVFARTSPQHKLEIGEYPFRCFVCVGSVCKADMCVFLLSS